MTRRHPSCAALEADLIAAATGEAQPSAARAVDAHVERCPACRDEFARYRAIDDLVGGLRGEPADAAEALVRERLGARLSALRRRRMAYGVFPSPLGRLLIARTEDGVSLVRYLGEADVASSVVGGRAGLDAVEDAAAVEAFYRELLEYLEGRRAGLAWPIDLGLARSDFQRGVLRATAAIPYGAVCSYTGLAHEVGRPTAARAVAQALRWNPVPIVVPCHRVVGASGQLVGYAGDKLDLKRRLLSVEGVLGPDRARIPRTGMYVTRPRERFYCLPTCAWIPTADHPHRFVLFASRARAEAAGLAPCDDCRPDLHPLA
jgi:O-6-methylguanine DNA methyltransferase